MVGLHGGERLRRVVSPSDGGHAKTDLLGRLNVPCLVADVEDTRCGDFLLLENFLHFPPFTKEFRGGSDKVKVGKVVPAEEGRDVGLGVRGQDADPVSSCIKLGKDLRHAGDGIDQIDALMEELQSALGDHGDAPALDAEMTDELTGAHVPGVLKLLLGQLLEPELPGHVVEDAVGDRSGVGNGSIEIKKIHSLGWRRDE